MHHHRKITVCDHFSKCHRKIQLQKVTNRKILNKYTQISRALDSKKLVL
jgi:hypothetical protein